MSGDQDEAEKSHEPSQKKIDDARRKGDVPKSADLIATAGWAGLLFAGVAFGPSAFADLGATLAGLFAEAAYPDAGAAAIGNAVLDAGTSLAPFAILPFTAALLAVLAQRAFVIAPTKLAPKGNRISPLAQAKQKFGGQGLFEFAKSTVKLILYGAVLFAFLWQRRDAMLGSIGLGPAGATQVLLILARDFMAVAIVIAGLVAAADYLFQRQSHHRKLMMSRKELMDEAKNTEGDPHMKGERRQRGQAIASNRMLADVPAASVVVTNPTHFAVALKWDRSQPGAPVCVAKGTDQMALKIREIATEAGVPIHEDPPTARALHATNEVGDEVSPDLYAPVATAIRFAEAMRAKARR